MANDYVAPRIISDVDDDVIHSRMLENLPDDIDKTEGGFAHDFTRPAALEKAEMLIAINEALQIAFPDWSYSGYLDRIAATDGLIRKKATAASGVLSITGKPGTVIPKGFLFATPQTAISANVEFAATETVTIGEDGAAEVPVQCTVVGKGGNVPQNSVTLMSSPVGGIASIKNPEPITGGTENETDDELRARIQEKDRSNESSFIGNDSDYRRWAKEVDGVGDVIVIPEWKGAGTGTVRLIVMDVNGSPANTSILTAVYNHIMSPDDRSQRIAPIGAILTVDTASLVFVDISATVVVEEGATIDAVKEAFASGFTAYFKEAREEGAVRYTRVGSILSETPGVLDYSGLRINSEVENIPISVDNYPAIGTITFSTGGE